MSIGSRKGFRCKICEKKCCRKNESPPSPWTKGDNYLEFAKYALITHVKPFSIDELSERSNFIIGSSLATDGYSQWFLSNLIMDGFEEKFMASPWHMLFVAASPDPSSLILRKEVNFRRRKKMQNTSAGLESFT